MNAPTDAARRSAEAELDALLGDPFAQHLIAAAAAAEDDPYDNDVAAAYAEALGAWDRFGGTRALADKIIDRGLAIRAHRNR